MGILWLVSLRLISILNHVIMVNTIHEQRLDYVSSHVDQTHLVESLFQKQLIDFEDIHGWETWENETRPDIFQWKLFTNFWTCDYERLIKAKIPVLETTFGTWVGITSFGTPYSEYVYPELINALFGHIKKPLRSCS